MRAALPIAVLTSAAWAVAVLDRVASYQSSLRTGIVIGGAVAATGLIIGAFLRQKKLVMLAGGLSALTLLSGPAAYAVTSVRHPVSGPIVSAGPSGGGGLGGFGGGGLGGFGGDASVNAGLVKFLETNQGSSKFLVATFGAQGSAGLIIATGKPVMAIGGFTGSDPAPTLDQFKRLVAGGNVRFLLTGNGGRPGGFNGPSQSITSWAAQVGKVVEPTSYGGASSGTLYDLSAAAK